MAPRRRVCVFCGSSNEVARHYIDFAAEVGRQLGALGCETVYGGATGGLMGAVANAARGAGGRVVGVIPHALIDRELAHRGLDELIEVDSMHARKNVMIDRSDVFLALPGGFGTLDELFEVLTLRQIGAHARPVALAALDGYWDPLLAWMQQGLDAKFVPATMRDSYVVLRSLDAVHDWLQSPR